MAVVRPFAALRPAASLAPRLCELPYDVMSSDEARTLAAGNPLSFLHVSKPEIDLPLSTDHYSPEVYRRGGENFRRLIAEGALVHDPCPCFYLYRQIMAAHTQTGLVAVASCADYLQGVIKKHELTRLEKEDDRVRHLEALEAQTGPAFLVYRAVSSLDQLFAATVREAPDVDFTAPDGVRHTSWTIREAGTIRQIQEEFGRMPQLYIADGHHRSAAAARVFKSRGGAGASGSFLAVIFPHNQVQILPYHRVLKDLGNLTPEAFLEKLQAVGSLRAEGRANPACKHEVGLYLNGHWHTLTFHPTLTTAGDPSERLDVALLQKHMLGPLLGITDPRTSQRIEFVGGIRGTGELERLVNSGRAACAISMFPTSIDDLIKVADAGAIMPPKSTWFEPKLRDGMFSHLL